MNAIKNFFKALEFISWDPVYKTQNSHDAFVCFSNKVMQLFETHFSLHNLIIKYPGFLMDFVHLKNRNIH